MATETTKKVYSEAEKEEGRPEKLKEYLVLRAKLKKDIPKP